ncbi:hypothetical protein [Methylobacterium sp. Leaf89]|uniref:hypothetical protein n=1 Tax=Methylobacterium sp. Leaf89 TaxID=1736245 RepID=UPI0006FA3882|nr:hypothetical protein [Methylobacterium sp. Leaf89]
MRVPRRVPISTRTIGTGSDMTRMRLRGGAAWISAAAGWIGLLAAGVTLAVAAAPVLVPAARAGRLLAAADDPGALAEIRLERAATPERLEAGLDAAVAAEDEDLALSFLALAETRGLPVDPARRGRVEALAQGRMSRAARDFAAGAVSGTAEGTAGLAGTLAADVTGLGDLRDLLREGGRYARAEPYDPLLLGMALVGLPLTVATWTAGAGAGGRAGMTVLKAARRGGRLSPALAASLGRTVRAGLDREAVAGAVAASARLDVAGARAAAGLAIRPGTVARLTNLAGDALVLGRRTGQRGVMQVLGLARDPGDVTRAVRLSERLGPRTRATLALLGRGALALGAGLAALASALLTGLAWCLGLALFCRRLGLLLGRAIWRRPRPPSLRDAGRA